MSSRLLIPHSFPVLLATLTVAVADGPQVIRKALDTDRAYESMTLRTKMEFNHGETKAETPKFGGVYNLINQAAILLNGTDREYIQKGTTLYADTFTRSGRETNEMDYSECPDSFTQNIDYHFTGRQSFLNGIVIPDAAFALDLRHTAALGNQTYNSVELELEIGTINDVFLTPNDTSLKSLVIEVWGEQVIHSAQSAAAYDVASRRYAEITYTQETRKVTDLTAAAIFDLPAIGSAEINANLSDLTIVQLDESGMPIPFDNPEAQVLITLAGEPYCNTPVWRILERQSEARYQPMPPNMLHIPLGLNGTEFGAIIRSALIAGATISVKANGKDNQVGDTCLHLLKSYTKK